MACLATWADARVFLTQTEALKLAFPGGAVGRKTAYLTDPQRTEARKLSGAEALPPALVTYYVGLRDGRLVGTAYFDTHLVRTLPETVMIVVDPAGAIARVEVLSFAEPEDYLPRPSWYGQFAGKPLSDELSLKRGIRPVTGATLTARATTDAARRILAVHRVIAGIAPPSATPSPTAPGTR